MLRIHGSKKKYYHDLIGINSRLDALQAAILKVKLKYLAKWTKARQQKAQIYNREFRSVKEIITPELPVSNIQHPASNYIYHQYTLRVQKRDELTEYLKKNDIPSVVYYPVPLHLQPAFKYLDYKKGDLPEAEKAAEEVLSLPIYPELPKNDQDLIIQKMRQFYDKK